MEEINRNEHWDVFKERDDYKRAYEELRDAILIWSKRFEVKVHSGCYSIVQRDTGSFNLLGWTPDEFQHMAEVFKSIQAADDLHQWVVRNDNIKEAPDA